MMWLRGFARDGWSLMGGEEHDCRDYEDGHAYYCNNGSMHLC